MTTKRKSKPIKSSDSIAKVTHTPAVPQPQLKPENVTLEYFHEYRHRFEVVPPYQRQQVWSLVWKQQLVDSIFQGDSIGRFEGHEVRNDKGKKDWIIDEEHQRASAILEFMDDGFKTMSLAMKSRKEPGSTTEPVEPGKYFSQLGDVARNTFLSYQIQIDRVRDMSENQRIERFRRIQNQAPLTTGELLHVYESKAKTFASFVEEHPFWACCKGRNNRQQIFLSCLYLLSLEMNPCEFIPLSRNSTFVETLATGAYDDLITDDFMHAVLARMDVVFHLYDQVTFTDRAIVIAMYQSVMFLEEKGYVIQSKDKGKLTEWVNNILATSKRATGRSSPNQPVQNLLYEVGQRAFWATRRDELMRLFGLHDIDSGAEEYKRYAEALAAHV